jgi:hypothetical protein
MKEPTISGNKINRRSFVTAGAAGMVTAATAGVLDAAPASGVSIIVDPRDEVATAAPPAWAAKELEAALTARGTSVQTCDTIAQARPGNLCIVAAGSNALPAREILRRASTSIPDVPEALGLIPAGSMSKHNVLLAAGRDPRGLVYALLDLADRVRHNQDPLAALAIAKPVAERPANTVRSVTRLFTSDVEDKPWYNDREMWPNYLTMLATQRFNRFSLALGIGYDFIRQVTDAYFLFSYPFLLSVPGYDVRVPQLSGAERDRNLDMLRFISEQVVARGMQFQLGLWMHGYEWIDSPHANYTIKGLTRETHGRYCRDALRMLLRECPAIGGITFRIHGESGVEEGSYDFWKTVFDGVAGCGRTVEIDMHSKGMDQNMLDMAVATRQPVRVSPKFWAEHLGMAYHQADIREIEKPKKDSTGLMKFSAGSRSFLRYGYGDLLREDRPWKVTHRIWPGTQRLLLWGDPLTAAAYSRAFSFCGSDGVEICEPLSFKGRRGSGIAGDRCAYADASLKPRWDWEKYVYGHRVWGRLLYNPDSDPDAWRRYLRDRFEAGAGDMEAALANASRILPIVTTSHLPSAANNSYWPEIYLNQSIVDSGHPNPYTDTPAPKVFGNASPLDPQLFSRINDFADELLTGERSGKYSPIEVAQWIENYAATASRSLAQAESQVREKARPEYRRFVIDVAIQAGLGNFFAAKFRGAVLYRIYEKTSDRAALEESLLQYRKAAAAWAQLADRAKGIYQTDITVGEHPQLRGHWADRLPAIRKDIELMAAKLGTAQSQPSAAAAIQEALGRPRRPALACTHRPPGRFQRGQPLDLALSLEQKPLAANLYYRHVNQAQHYELAAMHEEAGQYRATIPAEYTLSTYPLEYYFEVRQAPDRALLYPGLGKDLTDQPYFVIFSATRA